MNKLFTAIIIAATFSANASAATFDYNAFAEANPAEYAACMSDAKSAINSCLADGTSFKRAELRGASVLARCVQAVAN